MSYFIIFKLYFVNDGTEKERFCECRSDDDCLDSHAMHFCSKCDLESGACLTSIYDENGNCPMTNSKCATLFFINSLKNIIKRTENKGKETVKADFFVYFRQSQANQ